MRVRAARTQEYTSALKSAYTLTETADLLSMDMKTLRTKLRLFGITPERGGTDARQRLLTREQIDSLVQRLSHLENETSIGARLARATAGSEERRTMEMESSRQELAESIVQLREVVEKLNSALVPRLDQLITLEQDKLRAATSADAAVPAKGRPGARQAMK